ncbi:RNA polymerase I-specific transcription initiation factor RRN3 [Linum perenne]
MGVELAQNYMDEDATVSITDSELVYSFRLALKSVSSGVVVDGVRVDAAIYNEIVKSLKTPQSWGVKEVATFSTSIKALSRAVADIDDHHHEGLLHAIFDLSLWTLGPSLMDLLLELIVSLAASNGKFVDSCLDMLVNNFAPPIGSLKRRHFLEHLPETKLRVLPRIHAALKHLSELVPITASRIPSIVWEQMPWKPKKLFKQSPLMRQVIFVENMLKLESGSIREFVGSSVLRHLMIMLRDLDVSIGWDDSLHDDPSKGIFSMELEDESNAIGDEDERDAIGDEDERDAIGDEDKNENDELPSTDIKPRRLSTAEVAEMLDSLMVLTFKHLESTVPDRRLSEVFDMLLSSFKDTVLTTYKSKFAQFVMFYACALDYEHCGQKFANELMDMFEYDHNPLIRMSAVAYLSSFLARGKFLPPAFVAIFLGRLVDWCWQYCTMHDGVMNPRLHQVFYSGCQAIMYVLCFRMRSIMENSVLKSQLFCMPIDKILKHKLDPLKVCLPSIVQEFLKQAKAARLFTSSKTFVFDDLLGSDLSRGFGGLERLDMFFPFDPCMLKNTDRVIRPHYLRSKYVRTTYHEDIDDNDEEEEEYGRDREEAADDYEVMYDMEEGIAKSLGDDMDMGDFDNAWIQMSITPRNSSLKHRFGAEGLRMPSRIRPSMSPESL